jgi:hypothetical protein
MSILPQRADRLAELAERRPPESWIPTAEGDSIVGEFVRLDEGPTVRGQAHIMVIKTEDGLERSVWLLHTVLRNELARQRPQPGELVLIKYVGKKENTAGQHYGAYRVVVDREQRVPDWDAVTGTEAADPEEAPHEDGAPF